MNEPIQFEPLAMERVWGGRRLEILYGKRLPHGVPIGEIWEVVDREEAQSVVHEGPFQNSLLNELWTSHREEVFGIDYISHPAPRFPLLIKLLDAKDRLSVQVHPPARIAKSLGGEPKTEMWFFARCSAGARIYAGVARGVTRESFEEHVRKGTVEEALHSISVSQGDSIFIPSGRLHAIGEGNVIMEIQQNSDTTFRVYDWNRNGLDGKPRKLHIEESLACIDFEDVEPGVRAVGEGVLAECPFFRVERVRLRETVRPATARRFALAVVVAGKVTCGSATVSPGYFFLVPAAGHELEIAPVGSGAEILLITLPA